MQEQVLDTTAKYCVVCGMGSHRLDWIRKSGNYVACDRHSDAEMQKAISALEAPQAAVSKAAGSTASAPTTAFKKG